MPQMGLWLKRLAPQGLLGRSLLIIVMPLVVLQLVSAYVFYGSHWETVAKRLAKGLAGDIGYIIESMRAFPGVPERGVILAIAANKMELDTRFLPDAILPNQPKGAPSSFLERALAEALDERVQRPYRIDAETLEREVVIRVQLSDGMLEVFAPKKRLFSSTTYVFILWMLGTAMLLFGIATLFMRNQVRSVRKLAVAADRFGKGQDVADFKPEGAREVRQAAQAFNLMRQRIQRQIQQRTEMLAGVSHDLRTPLTRMKLQLAIMGDMDGRAELDEDVAEMERMVEGYLAFARGEGSEQPEQVDLRALVDEVVTRFRRQGSVIDLHHEGEIVMPLRPDSLARALGNLIGNASRYAGHVWVRVGRRAEAAEVLIDDDGPGIPPDRREEVFKPFTRLEVSRNLATGGVGLGLTIARDIVRTHGGDVVLEDSPLGGLRARVRLPL
ncbi:Osmolarity sensor protein EnvZ [Paramagnetospirillum magnetotacticum MS-1]|uniref:histidine kinase n=1 Tax=Paramagnetospirillum magnetotacticum MS-1 TaxID=272627 RepID=A0A0C2YQG2_PARME|nr:ATP-binding protein [Paramagnetospirillum magnetotacticum]KIL97353.1 Osmolarity sensor protein EnvZ [Paramagnetospirillum magnetotacticum MS-1]